MFNGYKSPHLLPQSIFLMARFFISSIWSYKAVVNVREFLVNTKWNNNCEKILKGKMKTNVKSQIGIY